MATTISARNAAQKLGLIAVNGNTTTAGDTAETVYTCPTGKLAEVVECTCQRNSYAGGMNTGDQFNLRVNTDNLGFDTVGGSASDTIDALIFKKQDAIIGVVLEAGDTINFEGEDGTSNNGNMKFKISIRERPV